ncbi:MAG: flavodoxin-dependent (E)-4-hydroxy-3-methylbut-2-enyl-diphosphate synthase [Bacillota bacterium]|jgi:(E)-4-hydroxy-3-methylbut-2-enyl-diphosphate synthase
MQRRATRTVRIGELSLGSGFPIAVQSMTNTDTRDVQRTLDQITALARAGCDLVRVAVPDAESVKALEPLCTNSPVPLVADIHYDHQLALGAMAAGVAKLRINPGTLAGPKAVKTVIKEAVRRKVPVRVGVNSGSVHSAYRHLPRVDALVKSAKYYCETLEDLGCRDIVVSLKSSSVIETYHANLQFARETDYPLHLGVTEAGTARTSTIKSAIGIGGLLIRGIGDTLRVSVTGPPAAEVPIALDILRALELRQGIEIISCPTCARSGFDVALAVQEVEECLAGLDLPLKVAVMGCSVNGPGEARHADLGIAFGPRQGVLFRKGEVVGTMPNAELPKALLNLVAAEFGGQERDQGGRTQ